MNHCDPEGAPSAVHRNARRQAVYFDLLTRMPMEASHQVDCYDSDFERQQSVVTAKAAPAGTRSVACGEKQTRLCI
jgi:hypothetical protein